MTYVLDACALIAMINREAGFETVRDTFIQAAAEECGVHMSIVNLVEVYYHFIRDIGVQAAEETMRVVNVLPLTIIDTISDAVYRETARFKSRYSMSLADAFACATAKSLSAILVTKDGEVQAVERNEALPILWIR
jgi:predicted nucleic acid-binding protein